MLRDPLDPLDYAAPPRPRKQWPPFDVFMVVAACILGAALFLACVLGVMMPRDPFM
jgi:hypothetical protein